MIGGGAKPSRPMRMVALRSLPSGARTRIVRVSTRHGA
jgi:hypothetical protein